MQCLYLVLWNQDLLSPWDETAAASTPAEDFQRHNFDPEFDLRYSARWQKPHSIVFHGLSFAPCRFMSTVLMMIILHQMIHIVVSWNGGDPQIIHFQSCSIIFIGFSIVNHSFWGAPMTMETPHGWPWQAQHWAVRPCRCQCHQRHRLRPEVLQVLPVFKGKSHG